MFPLGRSSRLKNRLQQVKSSKAKHVPPFLGGFRIPRIDAAATSTVLNKYLERFAASGVNSVGLHLGAMLAFAVERKGLRQAERWTLRFTPARIRGDRPDGQCYLSLDP